MASGFFLAEAADADRRAHGDLCEQFDSLAAGGVGEELALVAIEEPVALGGLIGSKTTNLRDEFRVGRKRGQPDIEVAVRDPAIFGHAARRVTGDADAEALFSLGWCANLESGQVKFAHFILFSVDLS